MFSSHHAIWKYADAGGELDDWLPYAEELIRKWLDQTSSEVRFGTTFEIVLAAYLLKDDLLPASAKAAFGEIMLQVIDEVHDKKVGSRSLHIRRPMPGRKENRTETFIRFHEVKALLQEGKTSTEAYKLVADKHFKSADTIRRSYERLVKMSRKKKKTGENEH